MQMSVRKTVELTVSIVATVILTLAGCGGGSSSSNTPPPPAATTYTTSAGVGEVLQFSINTASLTYSYTVSKTSYAGSGVTAGQTGSGTLTHMGNGSYMIGASSDSFIQSGKMFPMSYGMLIGHVQVNNIGGANNIPVFGFTTPITTLAGLAGTYNFEGFACSAKGIANVAGNGACATNYGTISIDGSGNVSKCNRGDISNLVTYPCVASQTRTLQVVSASPGVFDVKDSVTSNHVGWFFAFTAPNGQKVAVIDHDDAAGNVFGHAVLTTYASTAAGSIDGNYFKKDNEGGERLVTISGSSYSSDLGFTGTITYNWPWNGLNTFQATSGATAISGVAMATGTGAYTHLISSDPAYFGVGLKY